MFEKGKMYIINGVKGYEYLGTADMDYVFGHESGKHVLDDGFYRYFKGCTTVDSWYFSRRFEFVENELIGEIEIVEEV